MLQPLQRTVLLATVFMTGAAVLVVEVLAIRLLSPHFGTSMFVVSSVLTVVLAALALGYFWGGRVADRYPEPLPLYAILCTGGLALSLSYALGTVILPDANTIFSVTTGPLLFALLLFFIPAFLLGTDSPYVIKLLTQEAPPDTAGAITGTTFFWSTVGSIVGSLSAGFFFIPFVGIEHTLLGVATLLAIGGALAGWFLTRQPIHTRDATSPISTRYLFVVALVTLGVVIFTLQLERPSTDTENQTTLFEADGYYGHIRVYEEAFSLTRPPARFLRREVNAESAIFQDTYEHPFEYTRFADLYPALRTSSTSNMLLLGGGAYSIARSILANDPTITVDVVELEPMLFSVAQKYFDLKPSDRLRNHVMDARVFVDTTTTRFDYIFMDTFNSGLYIPAHLTTVEYFTAVRERLTDDGLLMINFIGARNLPSTTLTDSFTKTLLTVFPNLQAFVMRPHETELLQNIMFIATRNDAPLTLKNTSVTDAASSSHSLASLVVPLKAKDPDEQVVFTDNRSPADYLVAKQIAAIKNTR